jgi:6-phosphofructokinase 1
MESFWQDKAAEFLKEEGIEGLVVIGGDGSFRGAAELSKRGISVVGIPGTIDNDIAETDLTIGFRTAVETALEAVKRLRDTASSHDRLFIVEVMGRRSGFIALEVGVASGAEAVLVPEVPFSIGMLNEKLHGARKKGKTHSLIILAEGVMPAQELRSQLKDTGGYEARVTVLGHIQRGGSPCSVDVVLASQMGRCAVDALLEGKTAVMTASRCGKVELVPLSWSWERKKLLDPDLMELVEVLSI